MDMKCPSSGFPIKMRFDNFALLTDKDEIKFVVGSREDYEWQKT
jgi:7-carboxy-7-deazaguanine synthase